MANKSQLPTQTTLPGTDSIQAQRRAELNQILSPVLLSVAEKLPHDEILASVATGREPFSVLLEYLQSVGCSEVAASISELVEQKGSGGNV